MEDGVFEFDEYYDFESYFYDVVEEVVYDDGCVNLVWEVVVFMVVFLICYESEVGVEEVEWDGFLFVLGYYIEGIGMYDVNYNLVVNIDVIDFVFLFEMGVIVGEMESFCEFVVEGFDICDMFYEDMEVMLFDVFKVLLIEQNIK